MAKKITIELEVSLRKWLEFTQAVKKKYPEVREPREFLKRVCGITILWATGEKKESASKLVNDPEKLYRELLQ